MTNVSKLIIQTATVFCFTGALCWPLGAQSSTKLEVVRQIGCPPNENLCRRSDAIVFVHGIYGNAKTFTNTKTKFDLSENMPKRIDDRLIDVYRLTYPTTLLSWDQGNQVPFEVLSTQVFEALKPLRQRQYRSIGFVAHSLGGNIISSYLVTMKHRTNHAGWAQHAYMITLGTPVTGAQIAGLAYRVKRILGMNIELENSLLKDNLYLRMLKKFSDDSWHRVRVNECRPFHVYAGYEKGTVAGVIEVVSKESAGVTKNSPDNKSFVEIRGFRENHLDWLCSAIM